MRSIRTGRENIFVLGEWYMPPGWDVSKEFYYLENRFGVGKAELAAGRTTAGVVDNSELARKAKSDLPAAAGRSWPEKPSSNTEPNREQNTVNGLKLLPDRSIEAAERNYLADEIVGELGDEHSRGYYRLVAAKVPEPVIRQALAEIRADGAKAPAKVFTYRMNKYALKQLRSLPGRGKAAI
jgi:hypothetical protein